MIDRINSRTPEDTKKGLECCSSNDGDTHCKNCPYDCGIYDSDCIPMLAADALARIQQLERERDAAVDELSMLARGFGDECYSCRFAEFTPEGHECKRAEIIAEETGEEVEGGTLICKWEWKGLRELHGTD